MTRIGAVSYERCCLTEAPTIDKRMKPTQNTAWKEGSQGNKDTNLSYLVSSYFLLFLSKMESCLKPEDRRALVIASIESAFQGTEQ